MNKKGSFCIKVSNMTVCGLDLAEWLERLTANAEGATVLVRSQHPPTQLE